MPQTSHNRSNSWDHAQGMAEKHANSSGVFVRLTNDGDSIIGAFCGEPFAREVIWNGERYETFDPDEHRDRKPSLRVMLNFYVPSEHDMKVIEGGTNWFKDILKLRDKYGLENWLFEIQRHGEAGNPKTKYTILPEEKLDPDQIEEIESLGLHDLVSLVDDILDDDQPLDTKTVAHFVSRLKALPRKEVNTFLEQFKVKRVRDLKQSDETAARQLLGALEVRARRQADAEHAELDPFA